MKLKFLILCGTMLITVGIHAQQVKSVTVPANPLWTDTGIYLTAGEPVSITAAGSWNPSTEWTGPDGIPLNGSDWRDGFLAGAGIGELLAYVGSDSYQGHWGDASFFPQPTGYWGIGSSNTFTSPTAGELWLGFNDDAESELVNDNSGSVTAQVMFTQTIPTNPSGTGGTLQIESGTGSFSSISSANKILNVSPGATLNGTVNLQTYAFGCDFCVVPLIWTPSWGDDDTSYQCISENIPNNGSSSQTANISLTAPATTCVYHIIFAFEWEKGCDHVASGSNWGLGYDVWNDGNDIAEFNTAQISSAQLNGYAQDEWLGSYGPGGAPAYIEQWVPSDAITLVVGTGAQDQVSGTIYSAGGGGIAGVSVQIGSKLTASGSNGGYTVTGLAPGKYPVTVSASGYTTLSSTLTVPPSAQAENIVQNFKLNPAPVSGSLPTVTSITTPYSPNGETLYFLNGVTFPVTFTATVNWGNSHTPGIVNFITPTGTYPVSANGGNTASQTIGVGSALGVGGQLQVQAVSGDGVSSIAAVGNFVVMSAAPLNASSFSIVDEGSQFYYQSLQGEVFQLLNDSLPNGTEVDTSIPLFGGNPIDLGFTPSVTGKITGNHLDLFQLEVSASIGSTNSDDDGPGLDMGGLHFQMGNPKLDIFANYDATFPQWRWGGSLGVDGDVGASAATYLPVPIPVPVFASIDMDLPFDATLTLSNLSPAILNGTMDLDPTVTGTLGAGIDGLIAITGWLQGQVPLEFQYPATPHLVSYQIQLSGGVTAYALLWSYTDQLFSWEWPQNSSPMALNRLVFSKQINSLNPYPRGYLNQPSYGTFNGGPTTRFSPAAHPLGLPSGSPNPLLYALQTDVFPFSESSISANGTNCYAVWLYDNPVRTANNRTMLVYSEFNGTNWSTFSPVADDGTADFHPQLRTFADGSAVVAWENEAAILTTNADFTAMITNLEIATAFYDPVAGVWQPMQQMTTNGYLDQSPRIAGLVETNLMLIWVANTNNDLEGSATNVNQLWFTTWNGSAWSAPQAFASVPYPLLKYDMTYDGTNAYVVMSLDADNTLTNVNAHELFEVAYQNGSWGGLQQLTTNQVPDDNPQMAIDPNGHVVLAWLQGNTLSSVVDFNFADQQVVATNQYSSNLGDFRLASGSDGRMVIIWAAPSPQYSSDLWRIFYDPKFRVWGNLHQLTADPQTEMETAATFYSTNELIGLYDRVDIAIGDTNQLIQNGTVITNADLYVLQYQLTNDLALIASSLMVTPANPAPGDTATLSVMAANLGDSAVSNVLVAFYQGDPAEGGTEIGETNLAILLPPGATNAVSIPWTVPVTTSALPIYAVIDPGQQYADSDLLNNEATGTFVEPDLAIQSITWGPITSNLLSITATVINEGTIASQPATVSFPLGSLTGTSLFSTNIVSLAPGQSLDVNFIWNVPTLGNGTNLFAVVNSGTNLDFNLQNNALEMTIQPNIAQVNVQFGTPTVISNGVVQVSMTGLAGQTYIVEFSTNQLNWSVLTTLTLTNGVGQFFDNATNDFYQALVFSQAQPQLATPQFLNGAPHISVTGLGGQNYVIQGSTDLVNWIPLYTNGGSFLFTDPNATNFTYRFYRAVLP